MVYRVQVSVYGISLANFALDSVCPARSSIQYWEEHSTTLLMCFKATRGATKMNATTNSLSIWKRAITHSRMTDSRYAMYARAHCTCLCINDKFAVELKCFAKQVWRTRRLFSIIFKCIYLAFDEGVWEMCKTRRRLHGIQFHNSHEVEWYPYTTYVMHVIVPRTVNANNNNNWDFRVILYLLFMKVFYS